VTPRVEGPWLFVPLPAGREEGAPVTLTVRYQALLAPIHPFATGLHGTFGWTPAQTNLGGWYPTLAQHRPGEGWVTPPATGVGEYHMTEAADIAVEIRLANDHGRAAVAGSGTAGPCAGGEGGHCFALEGGRFAAYVISDQMHATGTLTAGGVEVRSVFLPADGAAGVAALETAARAIEVFGERFGAYPFAAFTLAEGDFYDGMEYSGMSFVGRSYYPTYDGTPRNLLTLIAAHEVAHQWWHTRVGNDPAAEPWLDEALATYAELVYLEAAQPEAAAWWWQYRVDAYAPQGAVDQPVIAFDGFRSYVDAVYLRGARMLHAMRAQVGDEAFFAFLRAYAQANDGRIASGSDFWAAFEAAGGEGEAVRGEFWGR
jgi:hypothetical protein